MHAHLCLCFVYCVLLVVFLILPHFRPFCTTVTPPPPEGVFALIWNNDQFNGSSDIVRSLRACYNYATVWKRRNVLDDKRPGDGMSIGDFFLCIKGFPRRRSTVQYDLCMAYVDLQQKSATTAPKATQEDLTSWVCIYPHPVRDHYCLPVSSDHRFD